MLDYSGAVVYNTPFKVLKFKIIYQILQYKNNLFAKIIKMMIKKISMCDVGFIVI